jgi:hypothetical protein
VKFLIIWKSTDPQLTGAAFVEKGLNLGPDVTVLYSAHTVGTPTGAVIVQTNNAVALQAAIVGWGTEVECEVSLVLDDAEAKTALSAE